jgi:hypothetical protein
MATIECLVKNISSGGAKITVDDSVSVPSKFDLCIPQKNRTYPVRMAWRNATAIGVEFLSDVSIDVLRGQLRALEIQNAELRLRVRDLNARLENLGQEADFSLFQVGT